MYITDCLRMLTENTAKQAGGSYMNKRYSEIIAPQQKDTRTGDEIVADVIARAGLEVV